MVFFILLHLGSKSNLALALALLLPCLLKIFKKLPAILEVGYGLPGVACLVVASPADEVLDLPIADAFVKDTVHLIFSAALPPCSSV